MSHFWPHLGQPESRWCRHHSYWKLTSFSPRPHHILTTLVWKIHLNTTSQSLWQEGISSAKIFFENRPFHYLWPQNEVNISFDEITPLLLFHLHILAEPAYTTHKRLIQFASHLHITIESFRAHMLSKTARPNRLLKCRTFDPIWDSQNHVGVDTIRTGSWLASHDALTTPSRHSHKKSTSIPPHNHSVKKGFHLPKSVGKSTISSPLTSEWSQHFLRRNHFTLIVSSPYSRRTRIHHS
jgi:hypothetical protein